MQLSYRSCDHGWYTTVQFHSSRCVKSNRAQTNHERWISGSWMTRLDTCHVFVLFNIHTYINVYMNSREMSDKTSAVYHTTVAIQLLSEKYKTLWAIWWVVADIMAGNESTNQRAAFSRKSLGQDSMLIMSAGHIGKFTVLIWKQFMMRVKVMARNDLTNQRLALGWKITGEWWYINELWPEKNRPIRGQHLVENHWSMMVC